MTRQTERHPIVWGLVALVVVAAVIGGVFGAVALVGSRVVGLSDASSSSTAGDQPSLYLPTPSPTVRTPSASPGASTRPSTSPSRRPPPITLIAGQRRVASFGQIDLSGSYTSGEGAVLAVQRLEDGTWTDFYSVTTVVAAGRYSTSVQTSRTGVNVFRMIDTDTKKASNAVRVRVG